MLEMYLCFYPTEMFTISSSIVPKTSDANDGTLPVALGISGLAVLGVATRRRRRYQE